MEAVSLVGQLFGALVLAVYAEVVSHDRRQTVSTTRRWPLGEKGDKLCNIRSLGQLKALHTSPPTYLLIPSPVVVTQRLMNQIHPSLIVAQYCQAD